LEALCLEQSLECNSKAQGMLDGLNEYKKM